MKGSLVLAAIGMILLVGCAEKADSGSEVDLRQKVFKKIVKVFEINNGMARERLAWNADQFLNAAQSLKQLSQQPWAHFQAPEPHKGSHARPEVWSKNPEFKLAIDHFQKSTDELVRVAALKQPKLITPAVQAVEDSCTACHRDFRQK